MYVTLRESRQRRPGLRWYGYVFYVVSGAGSVWCALALWAVAPKFFFLQLASFAVCLGMLGGFLISSRRFWKKINEGDNELAELQLRSIAQREVVEGLLDLNRVLREIADRAGRGEPTSMVRRLFDV